MKININNPISLREDIEQSNLLDFSDEKKMEVPHQSIEVMPFNWKRLRKYTLWTIIIFIIIDFILTDIS